MTPSDLVQACGMPALGLTDHHLLTCAVEFVKACKDAGIQPMIGDRSETGYASIAGGDCRRPMQPLQTECLARSSGSPLFTGCAFYTYSKDLIALNEFPQGLLEGFEDRLYYVALRNLSNAAPLSAQAHKRGLPAVVAHPVY